MLGGLELQEKFPFLTLSKKSSKNPICMASSKKSKIMTSHHLSFSILTKVHTPSKYVPVLNKTMAPKGSKTVPIKGSTEKRMIIATFTITLDGHFLPVQLIYGGKTSKSLPRVNFLKSFSLSANPKHYSNEQESIKVLEVTPYVKKEKERLGMEKDQAVLLIMDVFKGQIISPVLKVLSNNNILLQSIPANFTYLFQPLDVQGGPNGFVKRLMKRKFTDWNQIQQ